MKTSLDAGWLAEAAAALGEANSAFGTTHPGEQPGRQPVHTVYGGAQLFASDTVPKLGGLGLRALDRYAPDPASLGTALRIAEHPALEKIHARISAKLRAEPIEDFRIDFEDGYGQRPDAEEDGHAVAVAHALAQGGRAGTLAPFMGIRIKPLTEELRARSIRTLDLLHTALAEAGALPDHWVVTIPKITLLEQVAFAVAVLRELERALGLSRGVLRFEAMVETPQLILDQSGRSLLPRLLEASEGRLRGAHFGTYDYTAGVNIHRGVPTDGASRLRVCQAGHAGGLCGDRRVALRRLNDGTARAPPPGSSRGCSSDSRAAWKDAASSSRPCLPRGRRPF